VAILDLDAATRNRAMSPQAFVLSQKTKRRRRERMATANSLLSTAKKNLVAAPKLIHKPPLRQCNPKSINVLAAWQDVAASSSLFGAPRNKVKVDEIIVKVIKPYIQS
jgi:hypothetical protein